MNTDNFHWQQTIHLQTAPTVYTRSSDPNPDCNPGSTMFNPPPEVASFPGLLSPNAVEGLVKPVHRMTSGGRLEAWHFWWTAVLCMHGAISHASRRPPDVILRMSFTRPSTALGDRRPGNEATPEVGYVTRIAIRISTLTRTRINPDSDQG